MMDDIFFKLHDISFNENDSLSSLSEEEDDCDNNFSNQRNIKYILSPSVFNILQKQPWIHHYPNIKQKEKKYTSSTITFAEIGSQTVESLPTYYNASLQSDLIQDNAQQIEPSYGSIDITDPHSALNKTIKLLSFLSHREELIVWDMAIPTKSVQFHVSAFSKMATKILAITENIKHISGGG
uniref:UDENN domain-containing protein n=1 Tax=Rhabditophanes sp. KR3021 TaxID=114890 RepID=A0AC35TNR1_9BILA